jgi:hypothetical protein
MDSKVLNFLYLNGFVVLVLVAYLFWRPKRSPSRLKLRQTEIRNKLESSSSDCFKNAPENEVRTERQLTIIFQFNGHDFEAYEVLGLAAGSSLDTVEKCYQGLISRESSDTHEFFRMAYNAIKGKSLQ